MLSLVTGHDWGHGAVELCIYQSFAAGNALHMGNHEIPSFFCANCTSQIGVACKPAEGALDVTLSLIRTSRHPEGHHPSPASAWTQTHRPQSFQPSNQCAKCSENETENSWRMIRAAILLLYFCLNPVAKQKWTSDWSRLKITCR